MPCYIVQKQSVMFQAKHIEFLEEAIRSLNWSFIRVNDSIRIKGGSIILHLSEDKAEVSRPSELNQLKVAYSKTVLTEVAKRKRWVLKKKADRKYEIRRY